MFKTPERTMHMRMLVIYEIMKYQHWKKLFHLQGNRLKADESWNSIWHKEKKPIVSKLIMNMLVKPKDNYDFKQNRGIPHLPRHHVPAREDNSVTRHIETCVREAQQEGPG